jgi:hypothetical protein
VVSKLRENPVRFSADIKLSTRKWINAVLLPGGEMTRKSTREGKMHKAKNMKKKRAQES